VESAGTIAYEGSFLSAGSVEVMHETFGLDINTHRARSVTWDAEVDLILTMDRRTTDDSCGGSRRAYRSAAEQLDWLVDAAIERMVTEAVTSSIES